MMTQLDWLQHRPSEMAWKLLGSTLTVGHCSGRIVEVEAYEGENDLASHAANGPTKRNAVMFGPSGRLYVYKIYGVHWCANIVGGPVDEPGAILIRALEPVAGIADMWHRRPKAKRPEDLASGPGKLCAALEITGDDNGLDCQDRDSRVRLEFTKSGALEYPAKSPKGTMLLRGPRVGISKATELPWRFAIDKNRHISKPISTLSQWDPTV